MKQGQSIESALQKFALLEGGFTLNASYACESWVDDDKRWRVTLYSTCNDISLRCEAQTPTALDAFIAVSSKLDDAVNKRPPQMRALPYEAVAIEPDPTPERAHEEEELSKDDEV